MGLGVLDKLSNDEINIILSTAHPGKFPEVIKEVTGTNLVMICSKNMDIKEMMDKDKKKKNVKEIKKKYINISAKNIRNRLKVSKWKKKGVQRKQVKL